MKPRRTVGENDKQRSVFCKSKIVTVKARPIAKSHLMDWARENSKLLKKHKREIAFRDRVRD